MPSTIDLDFENSAKEVFEQFLLLQPQLPVEGLFEAQGFYYISVPNSHEIVVNGKKLPDWFSNELKPVAFPIKIIARRPDDSRELSVRSIRDIAQGKGIVRSWDALSRDLAAMIPSTIPFLGVKDDSQVAVILVERNLSDNESKTVSSAFAKLGTPLPMRIETQPAQSVTPSNAPTWLKNFGSFLTLAPGHNLSKNTPTAIRARVFRDDEYWQESISKNHYLQEGAPSALPDNWLKTKPSCLIPTTFPPANLRTYLSLYSTTHIVAPIKENLDSTISSFGVTKRQLVELSRRGIIRWLIPQSIERYDTSWLGELLEEAPHSAILSRQLAILTAQDQHRRNPLYLFQGTAYDRRSILRALSRLQDKTKDHNPIILTALARALSEHWTTAEYSLATRGAMTSLTGGLARFANEISKTAFKRDLLVELGTAACNVEWAGALNAHLTPEQSDSYSTEGANGLLVALSSGTTTDIQLTRARELELTGEILAFDNDTNVVEFATQLGDGDLTRFRDMLLNLGSSTADVEGQKEIIRLWNEQVRHYERRPDRLKSFNIAGIALAGASALSPNETISKIVPIVSLFVPMMMTLLLEDKVRENPHIGELLDWANATLAGTHPNAVLLSRMRKRISGMSEN
ncbi:hypothetical protein [Corallococcus sp. CA041A]|uniref:hypothetical protein n=1 Tax=Corallococcus sp. CA041A TaxID=2316727 RepID=UPI0011C4438C|nr:hypothetical protein [Corallococcus sp. CA041A]